MLGMTFESSVASLFILFYTYFLKDATKPQKIILLHNNWDDSEISSHLRIYSYKYIVQFTTKGA